MLYEDYLKPIVFFSNNRAVMALYEVNSETLIQEYTFKTNSTQNQSSVLDSDSDSLPDGYETFYGLNPNVNTDLDGTGDFDKDSLSNLYEYDYGITSDYSANSTLFNNKTLYYLPIGVYWGGTNPVLRDSDADGLGDYGEIYSYFTDPLDIDTDNDGLSDGIEVNGWQIFIVRIDGTKSTLRVYGDVLNAGDRDGDGLNDYEEFVNCTNPESDDTDSDGIPDNVEVMNSDVNPHQFNPNIQDSLPPTVKNVKISMKEYWTTITVDLLPYLPGGEVGVSIIDGISVKVSADISDTSSVTYVKFMKDSIKVDGVHVSGNTYKAGFWLGLGLGSLIKSVGAISVGFTVKVKAYDYVGNWNESQGKYDGPFRDAYDLVVSMLTAAWNALCAVAEKIKDALESLASWMWDLITNMIDAVMNPIVNAMNDFVMGIVNILGKVVHSEIPEAQWGAVGLELLEYIFSHPLFLALVTVVITLFAIDILITALTVGVGKITGDVIISLLKPIIVTVIIGSIAVGITENFGGDETIESILSTVGTPLGIAAFIAAFYLALKAYTQPIEVLKSIAGDIVGLVLGAIGVIMVLSIVSVSGYVEFYLDCLGLGIGLYGATLAYEGKLDMGSWVGKLADIIAYSCLFVDIYAMMATDYDLT
jgi:hypothetical protein